MERPHRLAHPCTHLPGELGNALVFDLLGKGRLLVPGNVLEDLLHGVSGRVRAVEYDHSHLGLKVVQGSVDAAQRLAYPLDGNVRINLEVRELLDSKSFEEADVATKFLCAFVQGGWRLCVVKAVRKRPFDVGRKYF